MNISKIFSNLMTEYRKLFVGVKYVLGEQYNVDNLWTEYLKAMGDI